MQAPTATTAVTRTLALAPALPSGRSLAVLLEGLLASPWSADSSSSTSANDAQAVINTALPTRPRLQDRH